MTTSEEFWQDEPETRGLQEGQALCTTREASSKGDGDNQHNWMLARKGEDAATRYLEKHGYTIVARNWRCPVGEADIVARDGDTVVFIEVKTRSSVDNGFPEDAVTPEKRSKYERIAALYLVDYNQLDVAVRFDVIAIIVLAPDRALLRHHVNAFGVA